MSLPDAGMEQPTGRALARNTIYNLVGQILPLAVAIVAVPVLIARLGTDGFGVLALAWMFVGYFSLFDLGLSRALTQLVARRLGDGDTASLGPLTWTALAISLVVGLAGSAAMAPASRWIVYDLLTMPDALRADALKAFYAIAVVIPVIVSTANLRGLLESVHRFDIINLIRIPFGAVTFAGPLVVAFFTDSLYVMVLVLVTARVAAWLLYFAVCLRSVPWMRTRFRFDASLVGRLLRFGGWMSVSNVVSPLMVYLDRFLIGVLLTASAVAYYVTPWEVVTKLLLIPAALSAVLFPTFSYWAGRDPARAMQLFNVGMKFVLLGLLPFVAVFIAFARPGLTLWIGEEFARHSYRPMQILALGVLLNGIAAIPFALIQGLGRADLTAKLHLVELPLYLVLLWALVLAYGITGAAVAWLFRVAVDLVVLYAIGVRVLDHDVGRLQARRGLAPLPKSRRNGKLSGALAASIACVALLMIPADIRVQSVAAGLFLAGFAFTGWKHLISVDEKDALYRSIAKFVR